jgi:hypothetical protein
MKTKSILLAVVTSMSLVSCATVDITKTASGYFAPKPASSVRILKTRPTNNYTEIATVDVNGFSPKQTAKMHNAIRSKAGPIGADAVIITDEGLIPAGFSVKKYASGVAVKYR